MLQKRYQSSLRGVVTGARQPKVVDYAHGGAQAMKSWILRSVRDVLAGKGHQIWTIKADATVHDALALMARKEIGAVLVVEDAEPVGVLSERDFARHAAEHDCEPSRTRVHEIMTRELLYVSLEHTVEQCMELMTHRRIRHLPVRDGGRLVGLVSIGDVVKSIITEQECVIDQLENYIAGPTVTA
jgi:CBS domain-containing protein